MGREDSHLGSDGVDRGSDETVRSAHGEQPAGSGPQVAGARGRATVPSGPPAGTPIPWADPARPPSLRSDSSTPASRTPIHWGNPPGPPGFNPVRADPSAGTSAGGNAGRPPATGRPPGTGRPPVTGTPPAAGRSSVPARPVGSATPARPPAEGKPTGRVSVPQNKPVGTAAARRPDAQRPPDRARTGVDQSTGEPPAPPGAPEPAAPAGPAPRRARLLAVLAVIFVAALVAGGIAVFRAGKDSAPTAQSGAAEPSPSPVLAGVDTNAPVPTPDGVRAAIDGLVVGSGLGDRVDVSVLDVATGQSLYDHDAALPTTPASTTKLVTAVTVLAARGPAYRIPTRVVAGGAPGEVVLIGGGDPTVAVGATGYYPGAARLDKLAGQVKRALGGVAPTKVIIDTSLFSGPVYGPGWDADIPTGGYGGAITALMTDGARVDPKAKEGGAERVPEPDLTAGRAFAAQLGLPATAVVRGSAPAGSGSAAPPGTGQASGAGQAPGAELGRVESPPMVRLVDFMLSESDNIVAESLARQVALARNQPASFTGAAAAVDAQLADLGLDADQSSLADGSGLSRTNRVSPALLAHVLALATSGQHAELTSLVTGLPVAGWSGTLIDRFGAKAGTAGGAGVVRAKTGTLTGVHAIAGVLTTADGRLLSFALMADAVPSSVSPEQAQSKLDKIAVTLAGCGCR